MRRDVQAVILILVGGAVLRISVGDTFLNYVKEGMRVWLLLSGATLVVLGVLALIDVIRRARRGETIEEPDPFDPVDDDGHAHVHGPRAAWLLLLPVFAIFLIAPPALGAYAAARDTSNVAPPTQAKAPPLPAGDPVEISVSDYVSRAVWDDGLTLEGRTVQMTGFVTPNPQGGWWLTRMALTCCAADAVASKVQVMAGPDLPADTWVTLTGTWIPGGGTRSDSAIPLVQAGEVVEVPAPRNPYQ